MTKAILIIGAILTICSLIFVPWRTEKTFTFAWQQRLPEPNDLAGWRLYQSEAPGGPHTLIETILFKEKQIEYRISRKITCPEKGEATRTFILRAFDTSGNESEFSNKVTLNLKASKFGVLGYDFIWSEKEDRTLNVVRMILQVVAVLAGVGASYWFASRKGMKPEKALLPQEGEKHYYCDTCGKQLKDLASAEVHRAFKHEVRELRET